MTVNSFGVSTGPIFLDEVRCFGNERDLDHCFSNRRGEHDCDHNEDVALVCEDPSQTCTDRALRLVNGTGGREYEGRVEMCLANHWGTVCDRNWDNKDAAVVCNALGFSGELDDQPYTEPSHQHSPSKQLFGDYKGLQARLCREVDGVLTRPSSLVPNARTRPLFLALMLISTLLGRALALPRSFFGSGRGAIWITEVKCQGTEADLIACAHTGYNIDSCTHEDDANVICTGESHWH